MQKFTLRSFACLLLLFSFSQMATAQQTVGLFQNDAGTAEGYTLFAPLTSTKTYLIDNCGREVHQWPSGNTPGNTVYLREDGMLVRADRLTNPDFNIGGVGGRVEILDWNGNVTWHYTISDSLQAHHHDALPLPNGNVMLIVWESIDSLEAIANGRDPNTLTSDLLPDKLVEIEPTVPGQGNIVWEWRAWDHLVQDFDSTKNNFGVVADHPELINLNYFDPTSKRNWMHCNGIDYDPAKDQIVISSHRFDEIWIIDHSTTTQEAASHSGGLRGKGGDLLYRWGNPQTYNRGTVNDQRLFGQHNIGWVPAGDQYAGMLKVFNNGLGKPAGPFSTADIWEPPMDLLGNYTINPGQPFGPVNLAWSYADSPAYYSNILSSVQRLPGNHTLICEGTTGHFFEIDSAGNTVWSYVNPVQAAGPLNQGDSITGNTVFRAIKYPSNYAGFIGHTLTAGAPIEGNPLPPLPNCELSAIGSELDLTLAEVGPNPFADHLTIVAAPKGRHAFEILGVQGRIVYSAENLRIGQEIATGNWPSGLYFLRIQGSAKALKLVKQ
ncbi:MAG: aryl-sulfate sulfotransferase [Bacteroidetes bacterium]|nr:aryl-sulfate sulfotransferase [Bacteroidota bacterium]